MKEVMLYQGSSTLIHRKYISRIAGIFLVLASLIAPAAINAQGGDERPASAPVVIASPSRSLTKSLPERIAGLKATGEVKEFTSDNLAEIAGDKAAIYEEYQVTKAAARLYGNLRVEIFETPSQYTAYGLYSFNAGGNKTVTEPIGSDSTLSSGELLFWKDTCFVRISGVNGTQSEAALKQLARAVSDSIKPQTEAVQRPALLGSLPEGRVAKSENYFLGPASLGAYFPQASAMFKFLGDSEVVVAEYRKPDGAEGAKLAIAEYHTPQFATEGMAAATAYLESLNEQDRNQIILKREGNFVIAAMNVQDREHAQPLVDAIKYPYVVKWLQTPRGPQGDPLQAYKAAQLLVSVFTLLGILLVSVLVVGSIVGAIIFIKRRKRQREVFSNAGDMLRLDLDPFESVILGLPPKRED